MPRLIFLIPYFGVWPFWMPFFLRSCAANPDIDWRIFTDCPIPENVPDNVYFQTISFADYCHLVAERLEIVFQPDNYRKLCDLKPALGYIHADILVNYDYWGFGDIDLVYGDLREFLTKIDLPRYALFSTHARRVSGHLCLMRNTPEMRMAFMSCKDWRKKLAHPEHLTFDEGAFSRLFIRHKNWPEPLRKLANKWNPWWRRSLFMETWSTPGARIPWHDGGRNFPDCWIWRQGRLYNDRDGDRSFPYFHFAAWKYNCWPAYDTAQLLPIHTAFTPLEHGNAFCITASGFREIPA
ncbi:MAG: hypothetical protein LBQ81_03695 [Zoogloeaceae bacterium]|jgi:hypothetical protein|nr:hypothetical protein [Zoogloeaceae bacterium]